MKFVIGPESLRRERRLEHPVKAKPFVKWPGGKKSLAGEIIPRFPEKFRNYYEPFVGGGAIFFQVIGALDKAFLSEVNVPLLVAYKQIKENVEPVIRKLRYHAKNHSEEYYYKIREQHPTCPVKSTARLIYLNKTCFNGLYRVNQAGKFNVPIGRHKTLNICDTKNLAEASRVLKKTHIKLMSFEKISPSEGDFVYCDPPYHDRFTSYTSDNFGEEKQILLRDKVEEWGEKNVKVMVSNSDTPFIRKIYKGLNFHEVTTRRYINCKGAQRVKETELVITNYTRRYCQETR